MRELPPPDHKLSHLFQIWWLRCGDVIMSGGGVVCEKTVVEQKKQYNVFQFYKDTLS